MAAVKEHAPAILGMSALLTTTLPHMAETIAALKEAGLRDQVKVLIGGAPVTQAFADELGADGYGANAGMAVEQRQDTRYRLAGGRDTAAANRAIGRWRRQTGPTHAALERSRDRRTSGGRLRRALRPCAGRSRDGQQRHVRASCTEPWSEERVIAGKACERLAAVN